MKIFENVDILSRFTKYKLQSVLRYIQELFQSMELPDVEGSQMRTLSAQNISDDGEGNMSVDVDTLESEVEIKGANPCWIRNNDGVLQYSYDREIWQNFGAVSGWPVNIQHWLPAVLYFAGQETTATFFGKGACLMIQESAPSTPESGPVLYAINVNDVCELHCKFPDTRDIKIA